VNPTANRFRELALEQLPVTDLVIRNENDPFEIFIECHFAGIGKMSIEPFAVCQFEAFQEFYDGQHPEWGLSRQSRAFFNEHPTDTETLCEIAHRVESRQDARFVILTQDHVVGYILVEEIDCIKTGRKTFWGEDYYAMLGIGICDRFHGSGLASLAMLFLKLVAAITGVGLGLTHNPDNERARRFYEKHGFVPTGHKEVFVPHTGERRREPWYILKGNEVAQGK